MSAPSAGDFAGARARPLTVGDWVRVVAIPPDVAALPAATRLVFARALGRTYRVRAVDPPGVARLDVTRRPPYHTIWVETEYLRRWARPERRR